MITRKQLLDYITESFEETKEATGASSAGGFTGPAFSMWSDDEEAKSEYKKKVEATEATSSSSVGAYDAPGFEDVKMKGNNPVGRGRSFKKPQIPGGGFVKFQDKCVKYNNKKWCSQGDSKDKPVKVKKSMSSLNEAIYNVSVKTGLSEDQIKKIILSKIDDNL
jgi:hypothetical protein